MKHGARRSHLRLSECMHYDMVGREILGGIRCLVLIVLQIIRVIYVSCGFKLTARAGPLVPLRQEGVFKSSDFATFGFHVFNGASLMFV